MIICKINMMKNQISLISFAGPYKSLKMLKRLSELSIGQVATIRQFEDDEIFLKLMEMGFIPGEKVTIEQVAPLGDPIAILISGYQVSLRLNEASKIMVEPV
jgi:ferrous iron transport protein A